MPAYNEVHWIADSLYSVSEQFKRFCKDWEIIVVDDGSTDGTKAAVETVGDPRVKVVSYPRNRGKGSALKEGFNQATGEFCFLLDSDLEIRAKHLPEYVEALRYSDLAIGSKRHQFSVVRASAVRRFLSLSFNVLERMMIGVRTSDTQAGIKAIRSTVLYRILPLMSVKKYAFDAELIAIASLLSYKIRELPVEVQLGSAFNPREVLRMLIDLLGISYRLRIRRWYQKNLIRMSETYSPMIPW